ncbi:MAG: methyltransferase domain-containing protein [Pseudomonadota bacterium]
MNRPSKAAVERLSFKDESLLGGYAESIDRFAFAEYWCRGKKVLEAGCGTGSGARLLLEHGAESVLGIDYSNDAIREARELQTSAAAEFMTGNLHDLARLTQAHAPFGAIVCFETLPHLHNPVRFLSAAAQCMDSGAAFVVSTPNRDAVPLDEVGRPLYRFQHTAYTVETLEELLREVFTEVGIWGQWLTPSGRLRRRRSEEQFAYLCDSYYQPSARLTRWVKRLMGRNTLPPPQNHSNADAYPGDFQISLIDAARLPWMPTSLIAVCRN